MFRTTIHIADRLNKKDRSCENSTVSITKFSVKLSYLLEWMGWDGGRWERTSYHTSCRHEYHASFCLVIAAEVEDIYWSLTRLDTQENVPG